MKELQMPKKTFYKSLRSMLRYHEAMLEISPQTKKKQIKDTLKMYDDFYEFLEHWKDYKEKKWSN